MDISIGSDPIAVHVPQQLSVHVAPTLSTPSPLAGKHVVVVGINYAPEPTGIAPYTAALSEHLAGIARHVTVFTGLPHYPEWRCPPAYRGRSRHYERHSESLDVIRHWHHIPRRQSALTRAAYEATFLASLSRTAVRRAPDVVVAVTPSLSGAVAGARLARRCGVPLVTIVQDLMAKAATQSGIGGGGAVAGTTARIEARALRAADRVVIVSEAFRPQLLEYGVADERIELVPNWSHITASPLTPSAAKRALGWPPDRFAVVHTGNMGLKQDLANVIEAARLLAARGHITVDVLLIGDGSQRPALQRMARGVPGVHFMAPVGEDEYATVLAAADLLLVNERPTVGDMSLPSKLTSYLAAGRPIVAAVPTGGAAYQELQRTGGAALCVDAGEPKLLANAITLLADEATRRFTMARAGRRYANANLTAASALRRLDGILADCVAS